MKSREQIIKLMGHINAPVTVAQILTKVKTHKTTVYREIEKLLKLDLITELDFGDGQKHYELASKGHHHHLICVHCKGITEYSFDDDFSHEEHKIADQKKFKVQKHNLEFFGLCSNCN